MTDDPHITETTAVPGTETAPTAGSNPAGVAVPPQPQATPPENPAPAAPVDSPMSSGVAQDIAKILQEVKLPERRAEEPAQPENQAPALGALPTFVGAANAAPT